jgi:hypothetical protein
MTAFTLPADDGKPLEIIDYKIDLLVSPPEIQEEIISSIDNYIMSQPDCIQIVYKNAVTDEGRLNIYVCKFVTGKYRLHIFGKIKGQEFRTEKVLSENHQVHILNERIKYVLVSSRNILRNYYLNANLQSMENHLMAFLVPS